MNNSRLARKKNVKDGKIIQKTAYTGTKMWFVNILLISRNFLTLVNNLKISKFLHLSFFWRRLMRELFESERR